MPLTTERINVNNEPFGGKEKDMFKNKEKDFYLQTPEEVKDCPPVIASIAQGVSDCLELETEMGAFVYDEDDQLADLLLMLYKEKNYRAAVQLLKMVFGVTGNESAVTLLSLIHPGNGEKTEEMFMKAFMYRSPRCRFREIFTHPAEENSGEEQ